MESNGGQKKRSRSLTTLEAKIDENGVQYFKLKKFLITFFVVLMVMCLAIFALTIASFYITDVPSSSDSTLRDRSGTPIIRGGYSHKLSIAADGTKRSTTGDGNLVVCDDDVIGGTFTIEGDLMIDAPVHIYSVFRPTTTIGQVLSYDINVGPPPAHSKDRADDDLPYDLAAEREAIWQRTTTTATVMQRTAGVETLAAAVRRSARDAEARHDSTFYDATVSMLYGSVVSIFDQQAAPYPYNSSTAAFSACSGFTQILGVKVEIPTAAFPPELQQKRYHYGSTSKYSAYSGDSLTSTQSTSLIGEVVAFFFGTSRKRDGSTYGYLDNLHITFTRSAS